MPPRFVIMPSIAVNVRAGHRVVSLWWLLAVLCAAPVAAQPARYSFDSWTTDNGLPSNSIWALRQTRDGYLWMTTSSGLVRFDGVRLTVFDKSNSPRITGSRFSALHEDRAGNLWAGTEDGGLLRYRDGVFTNWTTKDGLPGIRVDRIDEDDAGAIWVYTDRGIAVWRDGQLTKIEPTPGTTLKNLVWSKEEYYDRYYTGAWQRDADGWQVFRNGGWEPLPFPPPTNDPSPPLLRYMAGDSLGRLWYGMLERPHEYYCVEAGRLSVYGALPDQQQAFYQDRQGRLWASDKAEQITLWKDGQPETLQLQELQEDRPVTVSGQSRKQQQSGAPPHSLTWNRLVFEDREGNIWLGTYDKGLLRLVEQVVSTLQLPGSARERYVYPLMEDRAGNTWVSAGESGLMRYADGRFTHFPLADSTGPTDLSSLYEDHDGSLWVGTFKHGIARLRNGVLRIDRDLSARIKGRVDVIHRDRAGRLWFGGQTGLYQLGDDGQLKHYDKADGLASTHIKTLLEDAAGRLWLGGYGGVSLWQDGRFINWTQADGLLSDRVITLYEDRERTMWVGTYDGGLYRLREDAANWKLTRYTTREGLFTNEVNQILEDDQGFFWIGSARGIYRLRKQELNDFAEGRASFITSTNFGKADGMLNTDCTGGFQPAGFKARDGRLWFPTQDGVAVVDPRMVKINPAPPPVVIEECQLDNQPAECRSELKINPGQENLEVHYTGLSLVKSEQIRFRYKMEGLDHNWVEAGGRRTAYYSHLPPGEYTFTVAAANSDGVWNTEGMSLKVAVLPPFYQTWWFVTLALLGAAGLAIYGYRHRTARYRQAQAAQQIFARQLISSQESERKRIAAELHDSLGQHLVIIRNLALMFLQSPTDNGATRQQIEEISAEASQAIGEVKEISYNLRPYQLDRIGLTKAVEALLKKAEAASGVVFKADLDQIDDAFPKESEINFYRIVQESVNNIVKHAGATEAEVWIRRDADRVRLTIRDNGRGFTPSAINSDSRGGFGLIGISERAQLLSGEADIHSAPGQGTTISIKIILRNGHHER